MPSFFFSVVSAVIRNTRSKHKDTDYLVFALKVGASTPQTQTKYLGDLNSGDYPINLPFSGIDFGPGNKVAFNYMIVNAGSAKPAAVETALVKASLAWINGQGPTSGNLTSALQNDQPWFTDELKGVLNHDSCDGIVAAEQDHLTYEALNSMLVNDIFAHQTYHAGIDSPRGCGPNSQYAVNWEIDLQLPIT